MNVNFFKFKHLLVSALFFVFLFFSVILLVFIAATPSTTQEIAAIDSMVKKLEASTPQPPLETPAAAPELQVERYTWDAPPLPATVQCYSVYSNQYAPMDQFVKSLEQAGTQATLLQRMSTETYGLQINRTAMNADAIASWTQKYQLQILSSKDAYKITASDRKTLERAYLDLPIPVQQKSTITLATAPKVQYYTLIAIDKPELTQSLSAYLEKSKELSAEPAPCN